MAIIRCKIAALTLLTTAAFAQSSRTFHLANVPNPAAINEICTILRTIADIRQIHSDAATSDITVGGTGDQLTLAAWIVKQLDTRSPEAGEYAVPGTSDVVNILYLVHTPTQYGLNEVVSTLRAVGDVQRIFTYSEPRGIVLRTNADKAPMALWLAHQMDVSPDDQARLERHEYAVPGSPDQVLRVIYLNRPRMQPAELNELLSSIRTVADIKAIFTRSEPQGIAFRASVAQAKVGDWLMQRFDTENPTPAEFAFPGTNDIVSVFYLAHTPTNAAFNELITALRAVADVKRIFSWSKARGVVMRMPADQMPLAEWLGHQLDVSPDDKNRWQRHEYAIPGKPDQVLKVIYVIHPTAQSGLNEMVTTIRTVADVQAIFTRSEPQGIAFRGSIAQAQLADWLFQQLDVQPDNEMRAQQHTYTMAGADDGLTKVYYLNTASLNDVVTAIRSEVKARMFVCTEPKAVAIRGTADVIAIADRVIKEHDGPAAP